MKPDFLGKDHLIPSIVVDETTGKISRYLLRKSIFEKRAAQIAAQNAKGTWKAGAGYCF